MPHGMSVGGHVISRPCSTQRRCTASTSSTQIDIHAPLSAASSPSGPNVRSTALRPLPPWPSWHRKISHSPEQTPPNVGGVPQSQPFFHPRRSNHAKLSWMSETFRMGVSPLASMYPSPFTIRAPSSWQLGSWGGRYAHLCIYWADPWSSSGTTTRRRRNLRKHGIDFADAATVLHDEQALTRRDDHAAEDRFVSLGMDALGRLLVVVFTWRGNVARLISARRATRREGAQYEVGS